MPEDVKCLLRLEPEVRRQARSGPAPVRARMRRPTGTMIDSKKGGPTVILDPVTASEITGNMVPQNTANVAVRNSRLFSRKPLSRETGDSNSLRLLRRPRRLLRK